MLDPMVPAMGRIYNTFPNKCLITCRGQEIQERMILTPVVDHTRLAVKISSQPHHITHCAMMLNLTMLLVLSLTKMFFI